VDSGCSRNLHAKFPQGRGGAGATEHHRSDIPGRLAAAEDDAVPGPADFSNHWCENRLVAVFEVEPAHQPDILRREAVASRELSFQVAGQILNHGSPPAELLLLAADRLSQLPVQYKQVDRLVGFFDEPPLAPAQSL
jgi:hypothetical protein